MFDVFWQSLSERERRLLRQLYEASQPVHVNRLQGEPQQLSSMGLVYQVGPFWYLTSEGHQLLQASGRAG
ncbi:MAG: hypothetical protein QMC81_07645 [Thermoanaerobacterales bacterium]|nr:hypothetical protein [Bacillota bacterium]MDI6907342.1 hypothetical protein [Thermoanaerobacterales bacterium]